MSFDAHDFGVSVASVGDTADEGRLMSEAAVAGVASARLPVLWFCGAPGAGKSTVAWQVLLDLDREGVRAGYVDIDQLGMVYPPPDGDPDRADLKVTNLEAVVGNYARAGARVLVISGVVEAGQIGASPNSTTVSR